MTLYLLPNRLAEEQPFDTLPHILYTLIPQLKGVIAESEKGARAFLKPFLTTPLREFPVRVLNEHSDLASELPLLLAPLCKGEDWGVVSDAGLPLIADPGAELIALAKQHQVKVQVVGGQNSILMALQLSGFSGQRFAFHGYLAKEESSLKQELSKLERRSKEDRAVQIWMETPYRSQKMLQLAVATFQEEVMLSVAKSLNSPLEEVITLPIKLWRKKEPVLGKEPAIFLCSVKLAK